MEAKNEWAMRAWIAALRSGEYPQGIGTMHAVTSDGEHRWCPLGVLCDQHALLYKGEWASQGRSGKILSYMDYDLALPPAVAEWAGLDWVNPTLNMEWNHEDGIVVAPVTITEMNDTLKLTFDQVATQIEIHLLRELA